jgi:AcrR family transcriptional regulator
VPGTAAWWRARYEQGTKRRPRRDGLSTDRIRTAALRIVDEEGLEALTMRRLASEVGSGAASLYRHVANRDELLVEIMDHVLGEVDKPKPGQDWRAASEWVAREFRRVLREHPAVTPLLAKDRMLGPNSVAGREAALCRLLEEGFTSEAALGVYNILVAWVLGYSLLAAKVESYAVRGDASLQEVYAAVDEEEFPTVRRLAGMGPIAGDDAVFELGLVTLLDGIEARFAPVPPTR